MRKQIEAAEKMERERKENMTMSEEEAEAMEKQRETTQWTNTIIPPNTFGWENTFWTIYTFGNLDKYTEPTSILPKKIFKGG